MWIPKDGLGFPRHPLTRDDTSGGRIEALEVGELSHNRGTALPRGLADLPESALPPSAFDRLPRPGDRVDLPGKEMAPDRLILAARNGRVPHYAKAYEIGPA